VAAPPGEEVALLGRPRLWQAPAGDEHGRHPARRAHGLVAHRLRRRLEGDGVGLGPVAGDVHGLARGRRPPDARRLGQAEVGARHKGEDVRRDRPPARRHAHPVAPDPGQEGVVRAERPAEAGEGDGRDLLDRARSLEGVGEPGERLGPAAGGLELAGSLLDPALEAGVQAPHLRLGPLQAGDVGADGHVLVGAARLVEEGDDRRVHDVEPAVLAPVRHLPAPGTARPRSRATAPRKRPCRGCRS
jgi:hypothetical protein